MTLLIFYLCLAIGVSFLCSILEAVLLSTTPAFVSSAKKDGGKYGDLLDSLKEEVDRPLAAILSLNTIAHTVGAAGVGAQAQVVFQSLPVSVVSGVLTLLILVLSEIIPKTLGATYWRELAKPATYATHFLTVLLMPFVAMSNKISALIKPKHEGPATSREEISALASLATDEGLFDASDAKALQSLIEFPEVAISEILTPRQSVRFLEEKDTIKELAVHLPQMKHSRFPVINEEEQVIGFVLRSDLLAEAAQDHFDKPITECLRDIYVFPETAKVKHALNYFVKAREHIAIVVDEYGTLAGLVTLEDVLEVMTGLQIVDELDQVESYRDQALGK